jgi:hypothetical protein
LNLRLRGHRHLAQAREEKSLVDPTVEDRDAQLAAFGDDIAPVQPGFTRQLGGRQVIGHRSSLLFAVHYMTTSMQRHPDADNPNGRKYVRSAREFPRQLQRFMKFYFREPLRLTTGETLE